MSKYSDIIWELAYDDKFEEEIEHMDDELKDILAKCNSMFVDMSDHHWNDDSEIYGGITFAQFKRIYMILLSQVKYNKDSGSLNLPLPCKIGEPVWEIYGRDADWNKRKVPLKIDHISLYDKTIYLTEREADRMCLRYKFAYEARHQIHREEK